MKQRCGTVDRTSVGKPGGNYENVLDAVWRSIERSNEHKASSSYFIRNYENTTWARSQTIPVEMRSEQVRLGRGLRLLHLCRTSSLWTSDRMAWQHFSGMEDYRNRCPCCAVEKRVGKP